VQSFAGLGTPGLAGRLGVSAVDPKAGKTRRLAGIHDQSLLFYAGLLAQQKRNAVGLEAILRDYFAVPVRVTQFVGQWLNLEPSNQTRLGEENCELGNNALVGARVLDHQGKFRVRIGPLGYKKFVDFLPDRSAVPESKAFFLLVHLTRLYVRAGLDFDLQVVLRADGVPECQLVEELPGPRLGWNTWLTSQQPDRDAEDVFFMAEEVTRIDEHGAAVY
jgi:type VI secretion system protein ImpH